MGFEYYYNNMSIKNSTQKEKQKKLEKYRWNNNNKNVEKNKKVESIKEIINNEKLIKQTYKALYDKRREYHNSKNIMVVYINEYNIDITSVEKFEKDNYNNIKTVLVLNTREISKKEDVRSVLKTRLRIIEQHS